MRSGDTPMSKMALISFCVCDRWREGEREEGRKGGRSRNSHIFHASYSIYLGLRWQLVDSCACTSRAFTASCMASSRPWASLGLYRQTGEVNNNNNNNKRPKLQLTPVGGAFDKMWAVSVLEGVAPCVQARPSALVCVPLVIHWL